MPKGGYSRKQWGDQDPTFKIQVEQDVPDELNPGYDEYLLLLQERNRQYRHLREKGPKQKELEQKEQGFSLYLNGANSNQNRSKLKSRKAKTAGDSKTSRKTSKSGLINCTEGPQKSRAKTAPEKANRKNWTAGSINLKTHRGEKLHVHAPSILTGEYSEDFENSFSYQESESESESESEYSTMSESSSDEDEKQLTRNMEQALKLAEKSDSEGEMEAPSQRSALIQPKIHKKSNKDGKEQLMLSIADVKRLRQSLEMNANIRKSLAQHPYSDSDKEEMIPEEGDLEEEGVKLEQSPVLAGGEFGLNKKDMVVIEFASVGNQGRKIERSLAAARKSDIDAFGALKSPLSSQRKSIQSSVRTSQPKRSKSLQTKSSQPASRQSGPRELLLKPNTPSRSKNRPLSAHRKSKDIIGTADTTVEAKAVMEALRAENKKLDDIRRSTHSAPGRNEADRTPLPHAEAAARPASSKDFKEEGNPSEEAEDLQAIVQKVLKLDAKGQAKLLRALAHLEEGADIKIGEDVRKSLAKSPNKSPQKQSQPAKSPHTSPTKSASASSGMSSGQSTIQVEFQILSNWGHAKRIGLTEIQFFDSERKKIEVDVKSIKLYGAERPSGEMGCIFNGKSKTAKERNMWSCNYKPGKTISFKVQLNLKPNQEIDGLAKIKIWNFNKSLTDLNVGVKDMRINVDGDLVFEGEIDKGCGNQVFDYGKSIPLCDTDPDSARTEFPQMTTPNMDNVSLCSDEDVEKSRQYTADTKRPPPRSYTRIVKRSLADDVILPEISPLELDTTENELQHQSSEEGNSGRRDISGVPKPRKKSKTPRKSKMAARLGGSSSSVDTSLSINMEQSSDSVNKSSNQSPVKAAIPPSNITTTEQNTASKSSSRLPKLDAEVPPQGTATPPSPHSVLAKAHPHLGLPKSPNLRSQSPFGSDDETCMLQKIRDLTKSQLRNKPDWLQEDSKPPYKYHSTNESLGVKPAWLDKDNKTENKEENSNRSGVPLWLDSDKSSDEQSDNGRNKSRGKDSKLLENWPPTKGKHVNLNTTFDEPIRDTPSPGRGRIRRRQTPGLPLEDEENLSSKEIEGDEEAQSKMQQIESARAQWRKKEQSNLEESWTSLNMFERQHKGRLSMDMEDDIFDEYLNAEKAHPVEPTIMEEPSSEEIDDDFTIPVLPYGKELTIDIKSTWGDKHYVGMNGIELFTSTGELVKVASIHADPSDINILQEYNKDPRVASNLVDGVNRTRDDTHMWLAPFTKGDKHLITITFQEPASIAMMRIWNYNKSRIHSYRGAKDIEVSLDGTLVFKGEIARACGGIMGGSEAFGDMVLFTTDDIILEEVSKNDQTYETDLYAEEDFDEDINMERPSTADEDTHDRPFTTASRVRTKPSAQVPPVDVDDATQGLQADGDVLTGQRLRLNFTSTWGDPYYLGLTGMEVIGKDGEALPVDMNIIDADPRDLQVLPGYERDDRTLDKLINGNNITMSDENMWLIPFTEGEEHWLEINFPSPVGMCGLRFWNYNKSPEDTYRGAKTVVVHVDDRLVSPPEGFLIRKGCGNCCFDFAQEVSFALPQTPRKAKKVLNQVKKTSASLILDEPSQEYEAVDKLCGFIYQFHLLSTWGDPYYLGLNGIEFYDADGDKINFTENNISAYPDSINVLDGVENDLRTPDKLIDGQNDTSDGQHMWLAPILPNLLNRVYVIFDQPMEVSMIKLWNYSKTANRGVKDFALLVDDLLVYNGTLGMVSQTARGILPNCEAPQGYHTILFTDDKEIRRKEKHTIITNQAGEQDVQLLNDHKIVSKYNDPKKAHSSKPADQALRPTTSVPGRGNRRR